MAVHKVCQQCGVGFNVPNRRSDEVKYCSRECKTEAGYVTIACACCGVSVKKKRSELQGKTAYCSRECYDKTKKGRKHAVDPNQPRYFKTCEVCAKEFRVTLTRKDTARFCSRVCQSASPEFRKECSEVQQGDKHWRWSGGKYLTHQGYIRHKRKVFGQESMTFNHRIVMQEALEKAEPNHPFLMKTGDKVKLIPDVEVHHIDRDRANNELSNLLIVTKTAHAKIHHFNTKPKENECWPTNPTKW